MSVGGINIRAAFSWGTLGSVLLTLLPVVVTVVVGAYRILANGWKN
jgi:hypothetical protein